MNLNFIFEVLRIWRLVIKALVRVKYELECLELLDFWNVLLENLFLIRKISRIDDIIKLGGVIYSVK